MLLMASFAILADAAPAAEPAFKGSLALSQAMYKIAQTSLAQVTTAATTNGLLKDLFLMAFMAMVVNLLYEISKVIQRGVNRSFTALLNPDIVKKVLRALIFSSLALGAYGVIITDVTSSDPTAIQNGANEYPIAGIPEAYYVAAGRPFEFFRVDPVYNQALQAGMDPVAAAEALPAVQSLQSSVAASEAGGTDFGDTWVAELQSNNITPEVLLAALNMRIMDATGKINAWSFVTELQLQGMKDLGTFAAKKVWEKEAGINGAPPGEGGGPSSDSSDQSMIARVWSKVITSVTSLWPSATNALISVGIAGAYFAMDLMIVKVLWMNAIYLVLSYKLALVALPLALLLGYFPATTSLLTGVARHIIVCVLTFNIYSLAVAQLINPDYIKTTITEQLTQEAASATSATASVPDAALDIARQVYVDMKVSAKGERIDQKDYIEAVRARMGTDGMTSVSPGANKYTFYPLIGLLMLAFLVSLVGKISTILQDSLSGTMSYHRSG